MKKKMTILAVLVAAVVITGYSVAGTYAKYTTKLSQDVADEARIAKWKINETQTLDLFSSSYKITTGNASKLATKDGDAAEVVKNVTKDSKKIIAPGTSGSYAFKIVGGTVETNFKLSTTKVTIDGTLVKDSYNPIEVSTDGSSWVKLDDTTFASTIQELIGKKVYAAGDYSAGTEVFTLYWRWQISEDEKVDSNVSLDDSEDTKLGAAASDDAALSISFDLTATQVQEKAGA